MTQELKTEVDRLTGSTDWEYVGFGVSLQTEGKELVLRRTFDSFVQAIAFVNQVAEVAEQLNHHPLIKIQYNLVQLRLWSHDARTITEKDIEFAKRLEKLNPSQK